MGPLLALSGHAELARVGSAAAKEQEIMSAANDNYQMTPTSELIDDLLSERESGKKGELRG